MRSITFKIQRHFYLFIALVTYLLLHPIVTGHRGAVLLNVFNFAILLSAVYAISEDKKHLRRGIALCVLASAGIWYSEAMKHGHVLGIAAVLLLIVFYVYVMAIMLKGLFRQERITGDLIFGTISNYLLIGITFAIIHILIYMISPSSYHVSSTLSVPGREIADEFLYFSFVTLTTLGYGDILPSQPFPRTVAYLEAVTGVFYAAIIISRFVGIYVAQGMEKK